MAPTGDPPDPHRLGYVWTDAHGWVAPIPHFPLAITVVSVDPPRLQKRPVAWRVKDFADGWIIYQDEKAAYDEAEKTGALMQGLYARDGT